MISGVKSTVNAEPHVKPGQLVVDLFLPDEATPGAGGHAAAGHRLFPDDVIIGKMGVNRPAVVLKVKDQGSQPVAGPGI